MLQLEGLNLRDLIVEYEEYIEYIPLFVLIPILIHVFVVFLCPLRTIKEKIGKEIVKETKFRKFIRDIRDKISVSLLRRIASKISSKTFSFWERILAYLRHKISSFKDRGFHLLDRISSFRYKILFLFRYRIPFLWRLVLSFWSGIRSSWLERETWKQSRFPKNFFKYFSLILWLSGKAVLAILLTILSVILSIYALLVTAVLAPVFASIWIISAFLTVLAIFLAGIPVFLLAAICTLIAATVGVILELVWVSIWLFAFVAVWILFVTVWTFAIAGILVWELSMAFREIFTEKEIEGIPPIMTKELVAAAISLSLVIVPDALSSSVSKPIWIKNSSILTADMESSSNGKQGGNIYQAITELNAELVKIREALEEALDAPPEAPDVSSNGVPPETPDVSSNGASTVSITLDKGTKKILQDGMKNLTDQMKRVNNCLDVIAKKIESVKQTLGEKQAAQ